MEENWRTTNKRFRYDTAIRVPVVIDDGLDGCDGEEPTTKVFGMEKSQALQIRIAYADTTISPG